MPPATLSTGKWLLVSGEEEAGGPDRWASCVRIVH